MIFSSQCFLQVANERNQFYYYETCFRSFLEEIEDTKRPFEINWPLANRILPAKILFHKKCPLQDFNRRTMGRPTIHIEKRCSDQDRAHWTDGVIILFLFCSGLLCTCLYLLECNPMSNLMKKIHYFLFQDSSFGRARQ